MKNKKQFIFLFGLICCLGGITFSSCSDDDENLSQENSKEMYINISNIYPTIGESINVSVVDAPSNAVVDIDFGDGTDATGISVKKIFEKNGAFKIVANVTINGETSCLEKLVKVEGLSLTRAMEQFDDPTYKRIWVMAHRGNTLNYGIPENSLSAVKAAIAAGVDVIECDTHLTKDGHVVVCHDASIDRTTTGSGKIADLTLSQIKSYPLCDRTGNETTEVMPTLEEFLKAGRGKVYFNLDYSPRTASSAQVFEVVRKCGMLEQVLFYTGEGDTKNKEILALSAAAHPYAWGTARENYTSLMNKGRNFFVQMNYTSVLNQAAAVEQCQKDGMILSVNVLDASFETKMFNSDYSEIDELIAGNVRMIQADIAPEVIRYLKSKGYRD